MALIDFTPATVDLRIYAGDDAVTRYFASTDAPAGGVYVGAWDSGRIYDLLEIVEDSGFFVAQGPSIGITPGTNATLWKQIAALDLVGPGFHSWKAQLRSRDGTVDDFIIDITQIASSLVTVTLPASVSIARANKTFLRWDLQAINSAGKTVTLVGGSVTIVSDVTR